MKSLKKIASLTMCAVMLLASDIIGASAAETSEADEQLISVLDAAVTDPGIEPMADVIYWKYRYYNGHYQKRRWNDTKQLWVDLMWINCDDEFAGA